MSAKRLGAVAILVAVVASGCSNSVRSVTGGSVAAPAVAFPSQVLGLAVAQENVAPKLAEVKRPYVDSVAVFSLREDKLLRATLQVSRFNRLARPDSPQFRSSVIGLLGSTQSIRIRVAEVDVYSTQGTKQNVYVWFRGRGFFVLSVQQDFVFPRTLLRRMVGLDVKL